MKIKEMESAMEAILFASGEAVNIDRFSQALGIDNATSEKLLADLAAKYAAEKRGIKIAKLENSYQMCTEPKYADYVRAVLEIRRNMPLSQAAMEVLAVIAYNQPVTKAFIEQVRGVDCSGVLSGLVSKQLVEERGRLELPGHPLVYGTTESFLRCLNISSLSELPPVKSEAESTGR
ncbi:MAG TPA: SMC-Scp complex subunit ScpB, partial [Ruminococcaceae bacterium]|nr:SMC-Scp complex subunit ScpB [Oscillospiraceae bacterium]